MNTFKAVIIGSSVALRIRPPCVDEEGKVYGQVLESALSKLFRDRLIVVENLSSSRALITEVAYQIDRFVRAFPDLYIINIGAVDAPTREIPLWYSDIIFKRSGRHLYHPFKWFHTHFIAKFLRGPLLLLRRYRAWVPLSRYLTDMRSVLLTLRRETNAAIVVLGINSGSERIEKLLPGSTANYRAYDDGLASLCRELCIPFVDVSDLKPETHFPDGVHYNEYGHRIIATRILDACS